MKRNTTLIIALILLVSGAICFYWFEYRPSSIRQFCTSDTRALLMDTPAGSTEADYQANYPFYYMKCLNSKGLKE